MKKRNILLPFLLLLLCGPALRAQKGLTKLSIDYATAFPTGSFADFTGNATGRAFNIDVLHQVSDRLSIGGAAAFRDFYQKNARQTYKTADGTDISAVMSNSVQTAPLMAKVQYNFAPQAKVQPFAGAGVGVNFISLNQYLGEYRNLNKNDAGFVASPELGVHIPIGTAGNMGIDLSAAYQFMPYNYAGLSNLDHASVQLGIRFPLRR